MDISQKAHAHLFELMKRALAKFRLLLKAAAARQPSQQPTKAAPQQSTSSGQQQPQHVLAPQKSSKEVASTQEASDTFSHSPSSSKQDRRGKAPSRSSSTVESSQDDTNKQTTRSSHSGTRTSRSRARHRAHRAGPDAATPLELPGSKYFRTVIQRYEDEHQRQYVTGAERESDRFSKDLRHFLRVRREQNLKAQLSRALGHVAELENRLSDSEDL